MSNAAGGLSDALRQLADGVQELPVDQDDQEYHAIPEPGRRSRATAMPRSSEAPALQTSGRPAAAPAASGAGLANRQKTAAKLANTHILKLKQYSIPALIITGVLLLLPAIWSLLTLVFSDSEWVPGFGKPGARMMAIAMLAAWPLAGIMFAGAWFFHWQTQRIKDEIRKATKSSPSRR